MLMSKNLCPRSLKTTNFVLCLITLTLSTLIFSTVAHAYGGKVSSIGTTPVNEGSSELVTFILNGPIICQTNPCEVDLNLTSSDPAIVSFSTNPVIWPSTQWAQPMSTTINTVDNGIYSSGETVTITATVTSNSAYFSGYSLSFPLIINNIDPVPAAPSLNNMNVTLNMNSSSTSNVLNGVSGSPDPTSLTIFSPPSHGTAIISSGSISYSPNTNYSGTDALVYSVCSLLDATVCSQATLNFTIDSLLTPDTGSGTPLTHLPIALLTTSLGLLFAGVISLAWTKYLKT